MLDYQVQRIARLLKALDCADGEEDFVIHRDAALAFVKAELARIDAGVALTEDDLTRAEWLTSLTSLAAAPETIKRRSDYEILEVLIDTQRNSRPGANSA